MTEWSPAAISALTNGTAAHRHWLIWVQPKLRTTGARVDLGFWDGPEESTTIAVAGEARTYEGALGMIDVPNITYSLGTDVRSLEIGMGMFDTGVTDVIRKYDARFAPVELHCALYTSGYQLIGLRRFFKGELDKAPVSIGAANKGGVRVNLSMVSTARKGARSLGLKKSDASQKLRSGDRFRRYGDLGPVADAEWGG